MPLTGLRVVSFESRRGDIVEKLVRDEGGECFNASSVRERPLEDNAELQEFLRALIRDDYEAVILMTGVGTQYLLDAAENAGIQAAVLDALRRVTTVCRGPKPDAVLRRYKIKVDVNVPEPNTWRELAEAVRPLNVERVAIQEYGAANLELVELLETQGKRATRVPIYRWDMPEDQEPLERAARGIADGEFDIALFLSSVQLSHLLKVAERLGLRDAVVERLRSRLVVVSIGPVMDDALAKIGAKPDFAPTHPKTAICIREFSAVASEMVARKNDSGSAGKVE